MRYLISVEVISLVHENLYICLQCLGIVTGQDRFVGYISAEFKLVFQKAAEKGFCNMFL